MNKPVTPSADSSEAPAWPYSAEAEKVRQRCEALIPLMREHALENEENRGIHPDVIKALREAGAFTIANPKRWGGLALMPSEQARIIYTVARGEPGVAWNVSIAAIHAQAVARADPQFQEEVFSAGRGPTFGGGGPMPDASARKVDGGWMIKGRWNYCSTSQYSDWLMGAAIVDAPEGGKLALGFFVPKDPELLLDNWKVMGLSSTSSASFELKEEVFVPDHRTGPAMQILAGPPPALAAEEPLYRVFMPLFGQIAGLANALGTFSALLDIWHEATLTRRTGHPDFETQGQSPVTHVKAGGYRAFLATGLAVLDKLTAVADAQAINFSPPDPGELAECGGMFVNILQETANQALDVMRDSSTTTIFRTHPIQRLLRDIIVMNMHGASSKERTYEALGRHHYGLPPIGFMAPPPSPKGKPPGPA